MPKLYLLNPSDPQLEDCVRLLYKPVVIARGSKVRDPAAFARQIYELLVKAGQ
jgi:HSP90 family molecular chaperone